MNPEFYCLSDLIRQGVRDAFRRGQFLFGDDTEEQNLVDALAVEENP